jgi:hypothetical protein
MENSRPGCLYRRGRLLYNPKFGPKKEGPPRGMPLIKKCRQG